MTPKLTDDQRQALEQHPGAPVYMVDETNNAAYVLLPADTYQKLRALFDDGELDIRETYPLQQEVAETAWNHPDDAAYDDYDAHRTDA